MKASAIQMVSNADLSANLLAAERLLREAARQGAVLAVLPENFAFMGAHERDKLAHAEAPGGGPIQAFLSAITRELELTVVAGTIPLAAPAQPGKVLAACLVFEAHGKCVAHYDKVHLFDVDVLHADGRRESYRESSSIAQGAIEPVVVATTAGMVGLSVCYDLRFPELYRALVARGAQVLSVPSAFTARTGEAHWETLLRARAIENLAYVIAPGQSGMHPGGRATHGHSMIVDPWGRVLASLPAGEGVVTVELDLAQQAQTRAAFPVLQHRRISC
ncbi:MAG TPA: carbon-nitrogen hydrolase family protein [Solimonas sp.]|nr:carbon-nitrogen hydrolase family protein [Solimonas sp.]